MKKLPPPTLAELIADHKATKAILKHHDAFCLKACHFVAVSNEIDKAGEILVDLETLIADKIYTHIPENIDEFFIKCDFAKSDLHDEMTANWLNKRWSQLAASLSEFSIEAPARALMGELANA